MPYAGDFAAPASEQSGPPLRGGYDDVFEPPSGDGGGGGGAGAGSPYAGPMSPEFHFAPLPQLSLTEFSVPTAQDAMNNPGYQFRAQQGQQALERSAAAKGLLRTGGTLKDVVEYGQNFATSEYQNVFNRAMDAYKLKYQREKDLYEPKLTEWKVKADAEKARAMGAFQRPFDVWSKQGDWAHSGGGGGGGDYDPMPSWEEPM